LEQAGRDYHRYKSGNNWLSRNKLAEIENVPAAESGRKRRQYVDRSLDNQAQQNPGRYLK